MDVMQFFKFSRSSRSSLQTVHSSLIFWVFTSRFPHLSQTKPQSVEVAVPKSERLGDKGGSKTCWVGISLHAALQILRDPTKTA